MELSVSDLVMSTAGRDRGELFYVIRTEGVYALLANGKDRTVEGERLRAVRRVRCAVVKFDPAPRRDVVYVDVIYAAAVSERTR